MAACDLTRPLTQAEREAGFDQQRTGVGQALRPFSGSPTVENLIDYCNRELVPVLRATRNAANDVWKQVVDNAPSANPLAFYFSTTTAAADPTAGRVRLNQATQNTATIIRVSESNGRLQSVQPWLDVMSGGPTTPLGTVTLLDAINPSRFLRFDLNTMTDQGAYWDLGVTFIEGSDASPFVDGEAVTIGFIAGVSAAGSTVPVTALTPIARDTFVGNITTGTAAPAAVPLANIDSTSIVYDGTAHEMQRAALTGAVTSTQNSNATAFGAAAAKSVLANATNASAVPSFLAGSAAFQYLRVNTSNNALEFATINNIGWDDVLLVDATSGATSPVINSGQSLKFTNGASFSAIADGGTTFQMLAAAASSIDIRTTGAAKNVALVTQSSGNITFSVAGVGDGIVCSQGVVVGLGSSFSLSTTQAEVSCNAIANRPRLTMRTSVDTRNLAFQAMASRSTAASATNSTTVLDATGTYTIPANTLGVGSIFRASFFYRFVRGATATALNLNQSLDAGGSSIALGLASQTAAGTYHMRVEGEFTVLTTGAGGTAMAVLTTYGTGSTVTGSIGGVEDVAFALDTTTAFDMRGSIQMSAAVANCTIRTLGGYIQWIA